MSAIRTELGKIKRIAERGINRAINVFSHPNLTLLYHRVSNDVDGINRLIVTPKNFRDQMSFLKKHYLPSAFSEIESFDRYKIKVAVTFDDGYADNYHEAMPILEELEIPATFFVSSGYIDSNVVYWWDSIEQFVFSENIKNFEFAGQSFSVQKPEEKFKAYQLVHFHIKQLANSERTELLNDLYAKHNFQPIVTRDSASITSAQLREISNSPNLTVGAHTKWHGSLGFQNIDLQREEIEGSKAQLETLIGKNVNDFAYPFGSWVDFNSASREICKEAGFRKIAVNYPAQIRPWTKTSDIPRHLVRNWDTNRFAFEMKRFEFSGWRPEREK